MKKEFKLVEFCKDPYDTIYSIHPVFTELFNEKTPQSNVILGRNIILDGHHTLYSFCEEAGYGEKISIYMTNFLCMDIHDLYNTIIVDDDYYFYSYKFSNKVKIFYLQDCETGLVYQIIFPIVEDENGYAEFIQQARSNKTLQNCIHKNFRIHTELLDLAYPEEAISECIVKIITGEITGTTASIKYETYIDSCGNQILKDQFEEKKSVKKISYSDIINIYINKK